MSVNFSAVSKLIISAYEDFETMSGRGLLDLDEAVCRTMLCAGCVQDPEA